MRITLWITFTLPKRNSLRWRGGAINEAYRHRADGLAFPYSEKITLAFGCLRRLLSMIPDGPREEEV